MTGREGPGITRREQNCVSWRGESGPGTRSCSTEPGDFCARQKPLSGRSFIPRAAAGVSQYRHLISQPMNRTKMCRWPIQGPSPWIDEKISSTDACSIHRIIPKGRMNYKELQAYYPKNTPALQAMTAGRAKSFMNESRREPPSIGHRYILTNELESGNLITK